MKSNQQDDKASMTCKDCVFAELEMFEEQIQCGCSAGRLAKFSDTDEVIRIDDEDLTYFGLKRFCNLYRGTDWLEKKVETLSTTEELVEEALKESEPTFGISIFDHNPKNRNLERTIESIENIDYDKNKLFVIISSLPYFNVTDLVHLSNRLTDGGIKNYLVINNMMNDQKVVDYNAFSRFAGLSHVVKIHSSSTIPPDMMKNIHKSLNIDMEKNLVFKINELSCISFPVVNNEYLKHEDFDKMLNSIENASNIVNMIKYL